MKLYELLFTNEAAKTAEEAFQMNLVAVDTSIGKSPYQKIILFSPKHFIDVVEEAQKEYGSYNIEDNIQIENLKHFIRKQAIKESVVANITYTKEYQDLYGVSTSAATDKFGPLAYQLVMYVIEPSWLTSDTTLKPASKAVWSKMYELSNGDVYERKFLGEFDPAEPSFLLNRCSIDHSSLAFYREGVEAGEIRASEDAFLEWLKKKNMKPENFGYLWAYRKTFHGPKVQDLFKNGLEFLQEAERKFNIPANEFKSILSASGSEFFTNLYGSEASYTE